MILPGLLLAIAIIGYPIIDLAWTSMQEVSRFGQLRGFIGFANFAEVFADPLFYDSLVRTGIWTVAVVGGTLLISMPVAIILNDDFFAREDDFALQFAGTGEEEITRRDERDTPFGEKIFGHHVFDIFENNTDVAVSESSRNLLLRHIA